MGAPSDLQTLRRAHTETNRFQYGMKRAGFPLGRRAGFQRGFRYRGFAASKQVSVDHPTDGVLRAPDFTGEGWASSVGGAVQTCLGVSEADCHRQTRIWSCDASG